MHVIHDILLFFVLDNAVVFIKINFYRWCCTSVLTFHSVLRRTFEFTVPVTVQYMYNVMLFERDLHKLLFLHGYMDIKF